MDGVLPAVVRVLGPADEPIGAAVLVAPDILLTVAHVVSLAAGGDGQDIERPSGEIRLSFAAAPEDIRRAEVVHWVPPGTSPPEDIAGLRLIDPAPEGTSPAALVDLPDPLGRRTAMLGFPRDAPHGGWGLGRLAGSDVRGLIQVDSTPDSQFTLEEGFSGTPVWDVADGGVAGLVVEGWTRQRRSGFMIPTALLLAAWPSLAERLRPPSPFRGLKPFAEQDSSVFFGRDDLVERIVGLVAHAPALSVVGPSGIGKSSLLAAGVLPRLRRAADLVVVTMRPGQAQSPLRALAFALAGATEGSSLAARADVLAGRLASGQVAEVVEEVLEDLRRDRLLLVIDQFEEALLAAEEQMAQLAAVLSYCLRPGSRLALLLALRADFLGRALQRRDLAELVRDTRLVTVGELSQEQLRGAVTEPVARTRLVRYEPGLVDRLLTDVGQAPGRLPLLQFTLAMLWENQERGTLTHRAYDELGGVEMALARHAEAVWGGLSGDEQVAAGRLLVQLLYPIAGSTGFVARAVPRAQLDDAQWTVARQLAADRARLVVLRQPDDTVGAGAFVRLAHDALVTHWRRLGELGERDRQFREWQEWLRSRIDRGGAPLAGAELREALRVQRIRGADLSPAERTYLGTGRRRRTRRWTTGATMVVAVVMLAGLIVWQREHQRETEVAAEASRTLLRQASAMQTDPYARLRTVLRAYRTSTNYDTEGRVQSAYPQYAGVSQVIPDYSALPVPIPNQQPVPLEPVPAMAQKVSADGQMMVTTDPENNVTLWRVAGGRVTGHALGQAAKRVTISRDGRYLAYVQGTTRPVPKIEIDHSTGKLSMKPAPATACRAEAIGWCIFVYDTMTRQTRQLGVLPSMLDTPRVRFDPSGQVLAAGFSPHALSAEVVTWDVSSGRKLDDIPVPGGEIDGVNDLWLAPGCHRLLLDVSMARRPGSRLFDSVLGSVDLTTPSVFTPLAYTTDVAVSGDGSRVAGLVAASSGDQNDRPVVWDVATGQQIAAGPTLTREQSIGKLALDRHGQEVFVTSFGLTTTVLKWRVGEPSTRSLALHTHGWQDVLPLGDDDDAPLLLVDDNVVGLVFGTPGQPAPLRRLGQPIPPEPYSSTSARTAQVREWFGEMSAMLASSVPFPGELTDLPPGSDLASLGGG